MHAATRLVVQTLQTPISVIVPSGSVYYTTPGVVILSISFNNIRHEHHVISETMNDHVQTPSVSVMRPVPRITARLTAAVNGSL